MYINPIAIAYWRMIKGGFRTFASVLGNDIKDQVDYLAKEDVKQGKITKEKYEELTGRIYPEI